VLSFVSEFNKTPNRNSSVSVFLLFPCTFSSNFSILDIPGPRNAHASFTYDMREVSHNPQFEQCSFAGYDCPGLIGWPLRSLIVDDDDEVEVAFVRVLVRVVLLENDDSEKDHEFGEVTDDGDDDRCMIISSYLFSDVCVVFVYDT
jgi:hypothetical protein